MPYLTRSVLWALLTVLSLPAGASESLHSVSKTTVMNAPSSKIWEAIKATRVNDPAHRHVVSHKGSDYQIQERFDQIPVFGTVNCLYSEHEIEGKRIEYKLINSDKFLAFEGSWDLTPCAGGKQTAVTLTSFADTGSHLPFASKITQKSTAETVSRRLSEIRSNVECRSLATLPSDPVR